MILVEIERATKLLFELPVVFDIIWGHLVVDKFDSFQSKYCFSSVFHV